MIIMMIISYLKSLQFLKNVHVSKLLLYINFHTRPNDMSTMKAIRVTFDTFRDVFFSC